MIDNSKIKAALELLALPSPTTAIDDPILDKAGVELIFKRDDLIHVEVSGNKWRKLALQLEQAISENKDTILTYGGAFSNHIYATAAACNLLGLKSIGIIRGRYVDLKNPTLAFAQSKSMQLICKDKGKYALEKKTSFSEKFPEAFSIPEGGNNALGRAGIKVLAEELIGQFPDEKIKLFVSIGTGCTFAGLVQYLSPNFEVIGINVLKNKGINEEVKEWIDNPEVKYEIIHDYHFGGYAKTNKTLIDFANKFILKHKIPLDPIYTSKMCYAIFDMIDKNQIENGTKVVALHTGGLQGVEGYNNLRKHKIVSLTKWT